MDMKDSGSRTEFATGAVRDTAEGKPRLELISPIFTRRLAAWLTKAAEVINPATGKPKYGARNWEKGMNMDRTMASLLRHLNQYREGLRDEDHLAAAACNIMFLIHTEECCQRGLLPKALMDIPNYVQKQAEDSRKFAVEPKDCDHPFRDIMHHVGPDEFVCKKCGAKVRQEMSFAVPGQVWKWVTCER